MSLSLAQDDYDFGEESNYAFARSITCSNDKARKIWARAYCFLLNYNHEEAIACFQECLEEDPDCAMALWGIAYSLSPSYNWPPGLGSGHDAIQAALKLLEGKNQLEVDLIEALSKRHSAEARDSADPSALKMGNDPALGPKFCDAMKNVYETHKDNPDIVAIYVEGLMNLKPWTLWDKNVETGEITPSDENTLLIVGILEEAFDAMGYSHPGLCHLYCHCLELSPFPEKALPAADALRNLMPDAGHLVHMPSHIDAWVGQWKEGVECNLTGNIADEKYVRLSGKDSMFYKFYRMHNYHFVVWCAMFEGRYELALETARKVENWLPPGDNGVEFMLAGIIPMGTVFLEAFLTLPWHVMIRFGRWDEILEEPMRTDKSIYACTIATQHYARGVAYAAKGMVNEAEDEKVLFLEALENPALKGRVLHNNVMWQDPVDGPSVLAVNKAVLDGEIEYRKQYLAQKEGKTSDFAEAFHCLRNGVQLDLGLAYDEPWGQMQPVRHVLGALLLEQGELEEAEAVYHADVKLWKDNMWGLLGLKLCLEASLDAGRPGDRAETEKELASITTLFNKQSKRADVLPAKTCYCAQATAPSCGTCISSQ